MTRQIIDIGANANDGTGEPLRQAFQAVNDNFANIWAAGPVDSQVVISNNVISTNVTNLELILAGNGIGTVTVESTVVPSIDSVYDLGSTEQQFDSVYARYFYGNGRYLTGISGGSGGGANVTFAPNPPLSPTIGDIWIDSETAVQYLYFNDNTSNQWAEMEAYQSFSSGSTGGNGVPGGSNTQVQFNDNGNFGGISAFTFDKGTDTLGTVNIQASSATIYDTLSTNDVTSSGNISANIISATGNVTASYFIGNGSQLTGLSASANPGGSNTTIQYNSDGAFAGSANLVYNSDVNQLQLSGSLRIGGSIQAPSHANLTVQTYGNWGGGNYYYWTFDTLGRLVLPTVTNTENGTILANSANLFLTNDSGNVAITSNGNVWLFGSDSNLSLPAASVVSTPDNPGFSNYTQKAIAGAIETIAGNPLPSYTVASQTETIWTATNTDVTSARMTLRIQYSVGPVIGVEMCDLVVAKEWGTNANVSYVISNRLRTNDALEYANVVATLDGSDNLVVNVTNASGLTEYYSYSVTEFNMTND